MLGLYIVAAILGGGLLIISVLSGLDHDVGDVEVSGLDMDVAGADVDLAGVDADAPSLHVDHDAADHLGSGNLLLGMFRPRNMIFFLTSFGLTGMLLTWSGTAEGTTLGLALGMGGGAWALTWGVFSWLRRSESGTDALGAPELEGRAGRVVLPLAPGERGRVVCVVADREIYLTARLSPDVNSALAPGVEVVILTVEGGEAEVIPFDMAELPPGES